MASILALAVPASTASATPFKDISSAGPLTHVYLGDELSCQVAHVEDEDLEFYPSDTIPGDCGTFWATGAAEETVYGPDFIGHGDTAAAGVVDDPFTPVSQSAVTGSGTAADPYQVVTVADAGATGLRFTQTDSYVVGDEAYRTDIEISNTSASAQTGVLFRAGDCFLGGSDVGFGFTESPGSVGCSKTANNDPPDRIEEWIPLTGGNNFYQAFYDEVWSWIDSELAFPDTCECETEQDNGAGISWSVTVPGSAAARAATVSFSHLTAFSPSGKEPLTTTKTADDGSTEAGGENGYTITISNPNPDPVTLDSITDTLPAGFSYRAGSTTGATTADPSIAGDTLTWSGPFVVPADGEVTLHFGVDVADEPGDYFNEAGGDAADGYTVAPTGPTAKITVTDGPTEGPPGDPTCDNGIDDDGDGLVDGEDPDCEVTPVEDCDNGIDDDGDELVDGDDPDCASAGTTCFGQPETGPPTNGNDVLIGTSGPEFINGLEGDDRICGLPGDDILQGNAGADRVRGGNGEDEVAGEAHNDILFGGLDADVMRGAGQDDYVNGQNGADLVQGGRGNDELFGGSGPDRIRGAGGFDVCTGNSGVDTFQGCEVVTDGPT